VDTLGVLGRRIGIFDLVFGRQVRVAMATGTGAGQVEFEYRGIQLFDGPDIMGAVAVGAGGGAKRSRFPAHPVDTAVVFLDRVFMTGSALGRRKRVGVGEFRDARMAFDALEGTVNRFSQGVGLDAEGIGHSPSEADQGGVVMAGETVLIGDLGRCAKGQGRQAPCQKDSRREKQAPALK